MLDDPNELLSQINEVECKRIQNIDQPSKNEQYKQLFRIIDEYNKLEELEIERQKRIMYKYLADCGIKKVDCCFTYKEIIEKWKQHFLDKISKEQLANCPIEQYLWNVFTYNIISDYKIGIEAKQKFNKANKRDIYVFESDRVCHLNMPNNISASMFRLLYGRDIYFVDGNFKWTFIFKHEDFNEPIWYENN